MKKKIYVLAVFLFGFLLAQAQENESKYAYSNITEFGFLTTSPKGVAFEATTVNGFSLNKMHCLGIGIGIGFSSISLMMK